MFYEMIYGADVKSEHRIYIVRHRIFIGDGLVQNSGVAAAGSTSREIICCHAEITGQPAKCCEVR